MIWFAIQHMNPIVIIILIMSVPRVISLFRPRTDAEQRYFEVTPERRLKVAAMYFGLIALLLLGMQSTHTDLEDLRHIHQPAISQAASGGQTNGLERL
jgi:hypothetical protein